MPLTPDELLARRRKRSVVTSTRYNKTEAGKAQAKRQRERLTLRHAARVALARASGCADCGRHDSLQFHHLDPATKRVNVARMVSYSDAAFWIEVAKCIVVCQSCHTKRHNCH